MKLLFFMDIRSNFLLLQIPYLLIKVTFVNFSNLSGEKQQQKTDVLVLPVFVLCFYNEVQTFRRPFSSFVKLLMTE